MQRICVILPREEQDISSKEQEEHSEDNRSEGEDGNKSSEDQFTGFEINDDIKRENRRASALSGIIKGL